MWIELSQISPAARMSACTACGSNVPEVPALTTGVFIEHEGEVEVCKRCIVEAAAIYGLTDNSEKEAALEAEIAELRAYSDAAYADAVARQTTIETISAALAATAAERDEFREVLGGATIEQVQHGTGKRYDVGCRCDECREAGK